MLVAAAALFAFPACTGGDDIAAGDAAQPDSGTTIDGATSLTDAVPPDSMPATPDDFEIDLDG